MDKLKVKYPDVEVRMIGEDGNAFSIMGRVIRELRKAGVDEAEVKEFQTEAMSDDYDHLLCTVMKWVAVA